MDTLPVSKYVGKNLLANLGGMMDNDPAFKKEQYFQNILDNVKESNGALYTMPLSFSLLGLMDQEALDKCGVMVTCVPILVAAAGNKVGELKLRLTDFQDSIGYPNFLFRWQGRFRIDRRITESQHTDDLSIQRQARLSRLDLANLKD